MKSFPVFAFVAAGFCLPIVLGAAAQPATRPGPVTVDAKVAANCQKCHGPTGDSVSPVYPRLNGQQSEYIVNQLKAFRGHRRDDTRARGYMWIVARELDDKAIAEFGRYYASQKPTQPQTGGALAAEGEKLFMNGDPARGIVACQQCHGKSGEGVGAVPRIAGQHAPYLRMMLGGFQTGLRQSEPMRAQTKNMTDRQIEALASYLAND
jgi:cytochrome c553